MTSANQKPSRQTESANGRCLRRFVRPQDRWGKFPTYLAKVGSGCSCLILIKRVREFWVGQQIQYCREDDLRGMSVGMAPKWRIGEIWKIEEEMGVTMIFVA